MREITKIAIGFIAAIITLFIQILTRQNLFYQFAVVLIFGVWSMIPNKYFYVSSYKLRSEK